MTQPRTSMSMTEPRKSRWPFAIGALIAFLVLLIVNLNTEDSEERYHRMMWENSLVPCMFDPRTDEPAGLPCRSGDKIYTE